MKVKIPSQTRYPPPQKCVLRSVASGGFSFPAGTAGGVGGWYRGAKPQKSEGGVLVPGEARNACMLERAKAQET